MLSWIFPPFAGAVNPEPLIAFKGIYKVLPSDVVITEPFEEEKGLLVA